MVASPLPFAIDPKQASFKSDVSGNEIDQEIEQVSNAITSDLNFDFIHVAHREHALDDARVFNASQTEKLSIELVQGQRLLDAKKALTRKGEFTGFRNSLLVTLSEARRYMALAITFGGWALEKLIAIASATNIYALTQKKYTELVEQLRSTEVVTKEYIQRLLKEFRARSSAQKKKTSKGESEATGGVLEQHVDPSGGFYYSLKNVNLSEDIGSKLQVELETKSIGQVLAAAITPSEADLEVKRVRQELRDAVDEMRDVQIRLARENFQKDEQLKKKDERIKNLETELSVALSFREKNVAHERQVELLLSANGAGTSLEDFDTWEEEADYVNRDRDRFAEVVRLRSASEWQHLSKILSMSKELESQGFNTLDWLPEKLIAGACRYLSFEIEVISGGDNLVDDPTIEVISGCKFVSVREFGTKRECWVFQLPDKKNIPVFGREQFRIEQS